MLHNWEDLLWLAVLHASMSGCAINILDFRLMNERL